MQESHKVLRRRAKEQAKQVMRKNRGIMLAVLIVFLPSILFSFVVMGMSWDATVTWPFDIAVYAFDLVLTMPLLYGLFGFYLRAYRGEKVGVTETISCFWELKRYRTALRISVAVFMRTVMWSILPIFLVSYVLGKLAVSNGMQANDPMVMMGVSSFATLLCLPLTIKANAYQAGYNLMLDNPKMGAWRATQGRQSPVSRALFCAGIVLFQFYWVGIFRILYVWHWHAVYGSLYAAVVFDLCRGVARKRCTA